MGNGREHFGKQSCHHKGWVGSTFIVANLGGSISDSWPSVNAGCYIELFRNLGDVIHGEAIPHIKWEEAIAVVELIELAYESSRRAETILVPNTT
jgi:hypothetical protein